MQTTFSVTSVSSEPLAQLPGDWTTNDFRQILALTDYGEVGDLSDKEIGEMAYLSLADLPKSEAAELLISYVFPEGSLTAGQIKNSSHEIDTERLWEEYPEPRHHRNFYRVGSLLYAAYNGGHPKPDGRRLVVNVTTTKAGAPLLADPDPALVLRLLAPAMDAHALLHRLYEDELKGDAFPSAPYLLYRITSRQTAENSFELTIDSTDYWLADYRPAGTYEVTAAPDGVAAES
ncbi:hypothetical protein CLV84_2584 [Neolewinella xylanilytica]|uniref:Uncharacterized protein n=1 Tax=Neolewinella xylanilytica TaxID=1514080 RepID=A0A2S6I3P2_9BACT|nr:hypothetical protein [Neolewinella xylanilytica]PPK85681.1 hypothetical protein CLV84_2584 [Neolewinella xylanilytica]